MQVRYRFRIYPSPGQQQMVTLAKQTQERAWLGEVASVALVQACQDARRAYRNWFDSLSGRRKGCKNVRPGLVPADPGEPGTHRSAA